jgi:hypothetical protein
VFAWAGQGVSANKAVRVELHRKGIVRVRTNNIGVWVARD